MTDVFLSYSREDRARAKVLVEALRQEGLSVWWDPKILPGESWRAMIRRALRNAKSVVVLWSSVSVESAWVLEEAEIAKQREILFPVLIDNVTPPIGFGGIQCAQLVDWAGDTGNEEYRNLSGAIRAKVAEIGTPPQEQAAAATAAAATSAAIAEAALPAVAAPPATLPQAPEPESPREAPRQSRKQAWKWYRIAGGAALAVVLAVLLFRPRHEVVRNPTDGLDYVRIPAGTFLMGCEHDCEGDEQPQRRIAITQDFRMSETEVTVEAYSRFARATGRDMPPQTGSFCGNPAEFNPGWQHRDHPIVNVSYWDARAYCRWAGGDLPTEAQWEYAARGGTTDRRFPWGDRLSFDAANFGDPELEDGDPRRVKKLRPGVSRTGERDQWPFTAPVGSFKPNGYGLRDVIGNVQEWCRDAFRLYDESATVDPVAAPLHDGDERVVRGGSFVYGAQDSRLMNRSKNPPAGRYPDTGFRCMLPAQ
jgi:formylglycine-generating enzyme required for sulfatase activity